jgi:two-component system sensor histidine kinase SenX3
VSVVFATLAGLLIGTVATVLIRSWPHRSGAATAPVAVAPVRPQHAPASRVLDLLPTAVVLIDADNKVRVANRAAVGIGLVREGSLDVPVLETLVRSVRRRNKVQTAELLLDASDFPGRIATVGVRAEPVEDGAVALVVDDLTEAKRVEAVRRDFVANVGHEIKTPVGALQLLAEAARDARDDPVAVQRFVGRMQREAQRLARLVQELLDLSRLQGGDPLPKPNAVKVDSVVEEALDRARPAAEAKDIVLVRGGDSDLLVYGDEVQLITAVGNLLDNAVAYSGEGTRVAVGVHAREGSVEIAVSDEGIGIAEPDQGRIFERFYRVDPARSRETGGTGLGLAIVKHTIGNHGGEVSVWSEPGSGSTFTIRLPVASADDEAVDTPPTLQQAEAK